MYWQRRGTRVYVFEHRNGKNHAFPRARTRHLDGQPDEVLDAYLRQMEGPKVARTQATHPRLDGLVEEFTAYLREQRRLNSATVYLRRSCLQRFVFPYFLTQDPPLVDPNQWPGKSARLCEFLQANGASVHTIMQCNAALRAFWKWLGEENLVLKGIDLPLRHPPLRLQPTVLKFTLKPEDVLEYAARAEPEMAFLALTGYFMSLRTQEALALTRKDFKGGPGAAELPACKVMARRGLYGRFAAHVSKQWAKSEGNPNAEPKNHSKGWVACFNEEAARRIVALAKSLAEERGNAPLVRFTPDYNMHRWSKNGIPGVTLKDLRRASLYWLGHHTDIDLIELRSHARHRRPETTTLYLRSPDAPPEGWDDLDLDA